MEEIKPARRVGRRGGGGGGLTHRLAQMFFDSSCTATAAATATAASHLAAKRHEYPLRPHCKRSSGRCHCQQRCTAPVPQVRGAHGHSSCERRPSSSSPTSKLKPSSSSSSMCSAGSSSSDVSSGSHPNRSRRNGEEKVSEVMERGVALVKNSSDPYADFRSSMAEMIAMQEATSTARDMEGLLRCYLSLNSPHHHAVIMEAFVDIWEAMLDH